MFGGDAEGVRTTLGSVTWVDALVANLGVH